MASLAFVVAQNASAATIVISNGLAPPNPENVIDAGNSFPSDRVVVLNNGCEFLVSCPSPGAATTVKIAEGGLVGSNLLVFQSSSILMTGGSVESSLGADFYATVTIGGGQIGGLVMFGASAATVTGGSIGTAEVVGSMALRGGQLDYLLVYGGGAVTIFGSDFRLDGIPVGFGAIDAGLGRLTGRLASGDSLDLEFERSVFGAPPSGTITLVPEPNTIVLLGVSLVVVAMIQRGTAPTSW